MNKEDYLRKKGLLPQEDLGTIYTFKSTPNGVEDIVEHLVWQKKSNIQTWTSHDERWERNIIRYTIKDSPFECGIIDGNIIGVDEGHGSGFGDLWSWSFFCSLDKEELENKRQLEATRIKRKYIQSDEQQKIGTGQVIELNGKYWGRSMTDWYASWVDLMNATIYNNELFTPSDVVMDDDEEFENLKQATLLPIKQITTRQVGEF